MKIGIIGAMEEEVEQLKGNMAVASVVRKASMAFFEGALCGREAVVVKSGIGKVNAAVCTQILADVFRVDCIINTGIAGALGAEIRIGDIVVSTDAVQHDMDARAFGYPPGQIPRMDTLAFPADHALSALTAAVCRKVNPEIRVFQGRIVSGDRFIADQAVKRKIIDTFGGLCVEMEGAAIAQTAYLNRIPYVIIRAISDQADASAAADYPAFEKEAIKHCVNLTSALLARLDPFIISENA